MQAAFQAHTDLAVSKTINMNNHAEIKDVARAYWMAYENKCKGITIYRDGSKPLQVLEIEGNQATKQLDAAKETVPEIRERPATMYGVTERVRTGHGNTYINITLDDQQRPFEVFTTLGKAGSCDMANMEAVSRLASLALRSGIHPNLIVEQLQGLTCHPVWDQGVQVRSAPDAVALALKKHAMPTGMGAPELQESYGKQLGLPMPRNGNGNSKHSSGQICPECSGPLAFQEGCVVCQACAWNQCGG